MATARQQHTATLLPNGQVLVGGGWNDITGFLASAELYNPATGAWAVPGSLAIPRREHTATLLPNGQVLVTGGYAGFGGGDYLASAELYDPATGTWTATGSMATGRSDHTATLLPNGRVLVAGGINTTGFLASAELYDPVTGMWTATDSMTTIRYYQTATLLPNGQVLVAGGAGGTILASAELYNPVTGTWTATGNLATERYLHTATLLPSGNVLVTGGSRTGQDLASAELYDPSTGIWSVTGSLAIARKEHTATLLPNGQVLVADGRVTYPRLHRIATAELYDPASGNWTATANLLPARFEHTATLLPNGRVLVSGGNSSNGTLARADLYRSAP